jgi:U1 small nuclear ribonucleoprotein
MTQFLPPNLLALFAPREPIPFLPPSQKLPHEKKNVHIYQGLADLITSGKVEWEAPEDTPEPPKVERREERSVDCTFCRLPVYNECLCLLES